MARRTNPERVNQARRAAIRNVLIDEARLSPDTADEWIARWEAEASERGMAPSAEYWTFGLVWIREQIQQARKG